MSKKTDASSEGRYEIGKIVGVHGVRGDMLVLPTTDFPERFLEMESMDIQLPGKPMRTYKVCRIAPYEGKNTFFLHLQGIDNREDGEAMKGAAITVDADERVELEEDEYWLDDIIGLTVKEAATGDLLGVITEVIFTGSNDVYVVKTPEGAVKAIPAIGDVVQNVDTGAGTMTVNIPEGLWD